MTMEEGVTIEQLIKHAIEEDLTLEIDYLNYSDEKSTRVISDINISQERGEGYISAYCHMRDEQRTLKISRITDARIVPAVAKRQDKSLLNYEFDPSKPIFNLYGEKY